MLHFCTLSKLNQWLYKEKKQEIKGIYLKPGSNEHDEAKIALFADDTQIFLRTEESIGKTFHVLDTYSKASGARLNMKKTKDLLLGAWKEKKLTFDKIQWVKSVTSLEKEFGYGIIYEELWMKKFAKFKEKIKRWSK